MNDPASKAAAAWLARLEASFNDAEAAASARLFEEGGFWRDFVALTWNIVTLEGRPQIERMVASQAQATAPLRCALASASEQADGVTEAWFSFETKTARGRGHLRLRGERARTLLTAMSELRGFEAPLRERRVEGVVHRAVRGRKAWPDVREEELRLVGREPYCLIVGGSQGGLALAARLKVMGVPTLIVDALERPGDAWRSRYKSLHLHDPIWVNHLPYLPFPEHWPVYTPKDKMGDWLESYAQAMELNFWGGTRCERAVFDDRAKRWRVSVKRGEETIELTPAQLVLATGLSGMRRTPTFRGAETFRGVQHHSSDHPGGAGFAGKNCVVIGANNSAHDICVDLWENDADVTMVQRSPTTVVRVQSLRRYSDAGPYSENGRRQGIDTETADLIGASLPFKLRTELEVRKTDEIKEWDAAFYERLAASGFQFKFSDDGAGLLVEYFRRAAGYYIDVGGSDLIASGDIKLRTGVHVEAIEPTGVRLHTGELLPADLIVYATGYGPMEDWVREIVSPEAADAIGRCWGLGAGTTGDPGPWEGELRNMWKPLAVEALWLHGGNLQQSRFHSLHLALQIKARMEELPVKVFRA